MMGLARKVLLTGLLLTPAVTCSAQAGGRRRSPTQRRKSPPPRVEREVVLSTDEESRKVGEATVSYSPQDDRTFVSTVAILYDRQRDTWLELGLGFIVSGKEVVRPEVVKFELTTHDEAFRFRPEYQFKVKTDEESLALGSVRKRRYRTDVGVNNEMTGQLSFKSFEQFAKTAEPRILVGPFVFEMDEPGRNALRDLLRTVEPSQR